MAVGRLAGLCVYYISTMEIDKIVFSSGPLFLCLVVAKGHAFALNPLAAGTGGAAAVVAVVCQVYPPPNPLPAPVLASAVSCTSICWAAPSELCCDSIYLHFNRCVSSSFCRLGLLSEYLILCLKYLVYCLKYLVQFL